MTTAMVHAPSTQTCGPKQHAPMISIRRVSSPTSWHTPTSSLKHSSTGIFVPLHAADTVGDERVRPFYPSLYANIGEVYLRLGNLAQARKYIAKARETEHILQDDGYGRMIRSLIVRVAQAVEHNNAHS